MFVRCPDCSGRLSLRVSSRVGNEIEDGSLTCKRCGKSFIISRFIPRFVSSDQYTRSFSFQWNLFSSTQLNQAESEKTFIEKTGVKPRELRGKLVLEAGCGMGRFIDVISKYPETTVIGFDLSLAVEAAYWNVGRRKNVHIIQADIMKPPFPKGMYDFIFSIGVLHHTSAPEVAFSKLVPLLKKRGQIAIWVYLKQRGPILSDFYRIITSRMPWSWVLGLSKVLAKTYVVTKRFGYLRRVLPVSMLPDSRQRLLDTFDWYSPRYQFKFNADEVASWFRKMGLREVKLHSIPVAVSGKRP